MRAPSALRVRLMAERRGLVEKLAARVDDAGNVVLDGGIMNSLAEVEMALQAVRAVAEENRKGVAGGSPVGDVLTGIEVRAKS